MSSLPRITVVTPSFNSAVTIRETIESVLQQNYPNYEHWVIDGGSRDETLDILKQYPHLRWVSEKDQGHYHAMNKGIERATGDIINILNADDCYRTNALLRVGEAFQQNPSWDGVFGDVVYVDGSGKEIFRREEAVFDYDVLRYTGICYVLHQALFVRKRLHDQLGLYRHTQFLNCCDYDFILKLGRAGCLIGHVPVPVVSYRYHQHGQSADLRVTRNMSRESAILRKEHGCPAGVAGRFFRVCYRLKRQWQKLRYRGKCDLIPGAWHLKKHMQVQTQFDSNIDINKLEQTSK